MKQKIVIAVAVLAVLLTVASPGVAERHTEEVGDYTISFELDEDYLSAVKEKTYGETSGHILTIRTATDDIEISVIGGFTLSSSYWDDYVQIFQSYQRTYSEEITFQGRPALSFVDSAKTGVVFPIGGDTIAVEIQGADIFELVHFADNFTISKK